MSGANESAAVDPSRLIAVLNALGTGDLDRLKARVLEAASQCVELGQPSLRDLLVEAHAALESGDPKTFRKKVETVVAKLGHLR